MLQIVNNRTGKIRLFGGLVLLPGKNEIVDGSWSICCEHPVTKHYLQRGDVVVHGSENIVPVKTDESPRSEPWTSFALPDPGPVAFCPVETADGTTLDVLQIVQIDEMKAREAVAVIAKVDEVQTLRLMLQLDARPSVVKAINRRIAELMEG